MDPNEIRRIKADPLYEELVTKRRRFAGVLAAIMFAIYFGFVLLIAFDKTLLAQPIGDGVTTVGIPLGLVVIVAAFVLTGIYVRRANTEFDELTNRLSED